MNHNRTRSALHEGDRSEIFLIPSGTGELLYEIISKMNSLYYLNDFSSYSIAKQMVKAVKQIIPAEHYELFYQDNNKLKGLKSTSPEFDINGSSLVGFIAENKLFQVFNSPKSSTLYNSFRVLTQPVSKEGVPIVPETICGVPLLYPSSGDLFGVLMLYNKLDSRGNRHLFQANDVHLVRSIALLYSGQLMLFNKFIRRFNFKAKGRQDSMDPSRNSMDKIVMKGRRYKMLQQWCKQIFLVTNITESKQILAKNILQRMYAEPTPEVLLECSIQLISSLANTKEVRLAYKSKSHNWLVFSLDESLLTQAATENDRILLEQATNDFFYRKKEFGRENIAVFRVDEGSDEAFFIILADKKDDSQTDFTEYTKKDLQILEIIGKPLLQVTRSYLADEDIGVGDLRSQLRTLIPNLNTYPIISTIRTASQQLLDCDRGTIYLREGDEMVIAVQGSEEEIPTGFKVPFGKGIVGCVAQSGECENIADVYADPRFNPEVDKLTGYTTRSMICTPVLNSNHEVVAALQMINKEGGAFDAYDEETLDLFSGMVGSVLLNCELFQKNLEERTRLLNILNSIGTYIFVLDSEGKLDYSNKPVEGILRISKRAAATTHYSVWLRQNRQLMQDVAKVYQSPSEKVHRTAQKIVKFPIKKYLTSPEFLEPTNESTSFNYTILALQEVSGESAGAIIILEDSSEIEALSLKYQAVKKKLEVLTEPVQAFNSLQRCINRLETVAENIDPLSSMFIEITQTIAVLKRGNLYKAEVKLPSEMQAFEDQMNSRLIEYNSDATPITRIREDHVKISYEEPAAGDFVLDWNLNIFEMRDHFAYVYSMLDKLGILAYFTVDKEALQAFVTDVREKYEMHKNPYHNFYHGMSVLHSTFVLVNSNIGYQAFNIHELYSILISAFCHDMGHTGFNNMFEIASRSNLATVYNDISVLENFHASLTFQILQTPGRNIFEGIPDSEFKVMRKLMIECILSTDMGKHFRIIADMTSRFNIVGDTPLGTIEDDAAKLGGLVVHTADLAHPTKHFDIYSTWSTLVCKEFGKQVEKEREMGIPPTEFMMGLDDPLRYYKNEVGFITVIVKPLWNCIGLWLDVADMTKALESNLEAYQSKLREIQDLQ